MATTNSIDAVYRHENPIAKLVAGVDEAGRGPLAGSVVAAAVILDAPIAGLTDSKKLSAPRRALLEQEIKQKALNARQQELIASWGRNVRLGVTGAEMDDDDDELNEEGQPIAETAPSS